MYCCAVLDEYFDSIFWYGSTPHLRGAEGQPSGLGCKGGVGAQVGRETRGSAKGGRKGGGDCLRGEGGGLRVERGAGASPL